MTIRGYGCKLDKEDLRDHIYFPPKMINLPRRVNLIPKFPPCYDQLHFNSCVSQAVSAAIDYLDRSNGIPSRLFINYNSSIEEGYDDCNSGVMIRTAMKIVNYLGVPNESIWPHDYSLLTLKPSERAYSEALDHQVIKYERVNQRIEDIKAVLSSGYPIVFSFVVYKSFENNTTGKMKMPKIIFDKAVGRHAVVMVGYDDNTEEFIVRNSWGNKWGMRGNFTMPYSFGLNPKYVNDLWVITNIE